MIQDTQEYQRQLEGSTEPELIGDAALSMAKEFAGAKQPFDWDGAEIILRNLAVLTDRMTPGEFAKLSIEVQSGTLRLAEVAVDDIGVRIDSDIREGETEVDHDYRVHVHGVLHNLQNMVAGGPNPARGGYEPKKEPLVRKAVFASADLFRRGIIEATEMNVPAVVDTLGYFRNKTIQAINRGHRQR